MGNELEITVGDVPSAADREELEARLHAFNTDQTGYHDGRALSCYVRSADDELIAGLDGFTWGGYAQIQLVWVDAARRGEGLGRRLLAAAESEARARGCVTVVVSSHEFQAPGFYRRLGYEVVGASLDTPRGYREFTFQKRLGTGA